MEKVMLNIGCGVDYREGFINIDGSDVLNKVDKVIDITNESILDHFKPDSVDYVLANDIIEHHFHWEAVRILKDFYQILKKSGECEIRVPDCEHIIKSSEYSIERKLVLLFGGQDIPQKVDLLMDESRKKFPHFFCHKYGWNMSRMEKELKEIGFQTIKMERSGSNFITFASKFKFFLGFKV